MSTIICPECGGSGSLDLQVGDIVWYTFNGTKIVGSVFKAKSMICVRWLKPRGGQITLDLLLKDMAPTGIMLHKL